jgi:hypothetical protein
MLTTVKMDLENNNKNAFIILLVTTDILRVIQENMSVKDMKELFVTTKALGQARYLCFYWNLGEGKSWEYYRDAAFRHVCASRMSDTRKQLSLQFINRPEISDVSFFENVHALELLDCGWITDVSMLGNVHTLHLSGSHSVTDVSMLGNVHTLILKNCRYITDVSMRQCSQIGFEYQHDRDRRYQHARQCAHLGFEGQPLKIIRCKHARQCSHIVFEWLLRNIRCKHALQCAQTNYRSLPWNNRC